MLDVVRLRVLDAVARHGSVTVAARELNYSQPSVSHHLARLEAETGAQLPRRVGRGIRLTQAGELLAGRAAEIIGRLDAAEAGLSAHVGLTAGRVRVAGFALGDRVAGAARGGGARPRASRVGDRLDGHRIRRRRSSCYGPGRSRWRSSSATTTPRTSVRYPPEAPARRSDVPAVGPSYARAGEPARGDLDRRVRTLPRAPARAVRRRGLRATHRLRVRRHGAHPGARRRRAVRGHAAGPCPARPPRRRRRRLSSFPACRGACTPRRTARRPTRRRSPRCSARSAGRPPPPSKADNPPAGRTYPVSDPPAGAECGGVAALAASTGVQQIAFLCLGAVACAAAAAPQASAHDPSRQRPARCRRHR